MTETLETQYKAIKTLKQQINKLENTIKYQRRIQTGNHIPQKYAPKNYPESEDLSLTQQFKKELRHTFYNHLETVINANNIALEIKRARMSNLTQTAEHIIANTTLHHSDTVYMYQNLLQNVNLPNQHPTAISLRTKYTTPTKGTEHHQGQPQPQSNLLNNRKRTRYLPPPPQSKKPKQNHTPTHPLEERSHNYHNQIQTVHNLSSTTLSAPVVSLLSKGMSFTPTPQYNSPTDAELQLLWQYNTYSDHLRRLCNNSTCSEPQMYDQTPSTDIHMPPLYRKMKFLNKKNTYRQPQPYCGVLSVESYIYDTKEELASELSNLFNTKSNNLSHEETLAIKALRHMKNLTVKPADKNLGIAVLNTHDYLTQCMSHLTSPSYQLVQAFPNTLEQNLENILISFKTELTNLQPTLYKFLTSSLKKSRVPLFYGIPKLHKPPNENGLPPIRPIVSHTNSILSNTAKLIDHILQPLAQSYPDHLLNSTELVSKLAELKIQETITLVSMDVKNLYPSIPQLECLQVIHQELLSNQHMLICDPNLIMQLLEFNLRNNFFEFANLCFFQKSGIAMGAAFAPTAANIFMSVLTRNFLKTTQEHPILIARYIDDIFLIWPTKFNLDHFIEKINKHHPNIQYTTIQSEQEIDFLDLTIYKGELFHNHNSLDIKTFQKPHNLFQYLHFQSFHPKSTYKGIILGESVRYIRTNTNELNYRLQLSLLKTRLEARGYPTKFIEKYLHRASFQNRTQYLKPKQNAITNQPPRPIFKCLTPPRFKQLKHIVLKNYKNIEKFFGKPLFITAQHKTLGNTLVRAKYTPTDTEFVEFLLLNDYQPEERPPPPPNNNVFQTKKIKPIQPKPCGHRRCSTCSHFNRSKTFTSTITKQTYRIRQNFTCASRNTIYLITCRKCHKQYVGQTTKSLRERTNHHRSTILTKQNRYISLHFNLPDHKITDLSIQAIDTADANRLVSLERYWITTLRTVKPLGLNYTN